MSWFDMQSSAMRTRSMTAFVLMNFNCVFFVSGLLAENHEQCWSCIQSEHGKHFSCSQELLSKLGTGLAT